MNDVLPKPFTKEGLLQMLEKHLGHLKKQSHALDHMGAPSAPSSLAHVAAKNSLKSEDSPVTSPATASNWNSPGGAIGVSPAPSNVTADEYMSAIGQGHTPGSYSLPSGLTPHISFATSPQTAMGRPPPPGQQTSIAPHRRQISEISGGPGEMGNDIKRQQIFTQGGLPPPPMMAVPPHMGPPHSMQQPVGSGQPLQHPLNLMPRRSG